MVRLTWLVAAVCTVALAVGAGPACADGHNVFISNCAVCHQPDGKGAPGVYPPLANSVGRYVALKDGRAYLIDVMSFGMGGKIESAGDSFEGDMPPWPQLSDEDVAQTLTYVLTGLNSKLLPADFKPISAEEVKAERAKQLTSATVHSERDSLMKEMVDKGANAAARPVAVASPAATASPAASAAGESITPADGRSIFVSNCAVCHQPDGKGAPGVYPPLAGTVGRYVALKDGRAYLIDVLSFGMGGKIKSAGDSYEGDMPPWPQLNDQQVAHVLTYVLTGLNPKTLPADFKPISADEVKAERARQLNAAAIHSERDSVLKELGDKAASQ
jgi:mono/diheme cytochrome c family protein